MSSKFQLASKGFRILSSTSFKSPLLQRISFCSEKKMKKEISNLQKISKKSKITSNVSKMTSNLSSAKITDAKTSTQKKKPSSSGRTKQDLAAFPVQVQTAIQQLRKSSQAGISPLKSVHILPPQTILGSIPFDQHIVYCIHSIQKPWISYIGYTNNLDKRLRQHNRELAGGAKKTARSYPWALSFCLYGFPDRSTALSFEWFNQHRLPSRSRTLLTRLQNLTRICKTHKWSHLTLSLIVQIPPSVSVPPTLSREDDEK